MVSIVTKKINNNEYLYLVESVRKNTKVIQKTIKYIGKKRIITKEEFECMKISHKNKDWILNNFKDELSYQNHEEMKQASNKYKQYINQLDEISKQNEKEKFLVKFISNSNAIEGSTLTFDDTYNYLFNDLTPEGHSKKELYMASNLLKAWNYVEKNHNKFPSEKDLFQLHKMVNENIETEQTLGKYKIIQNYIGNIYTTSYLFVKERIIKLFFWIKKAFKQVNDFEVAFQSHTQFEIIHPFVDGNGRIGRLLLNWILMYKDLEPLAIRFNKRLKYINALDNSRKGKIEAICKFCYEEYINQYQFMN